MSMIEFHLNEWTYTLAKRMADERNLTVEQVVSEAIARLAAAPSDQSPGDEIIGAFSDCADLLDEIVEEAYLNRERYPLRLKSE